MIVNRLSRVDPSMTGGLRKGLERFFRKLLAQFYKAMLEFLETGVRRFTAQSFRLVQNVGELDEVEKFARYLQRRFSQIYRGLSVEETIRKFIRLGFERGAARSVEQVIDALRRAGRERGRLYLGTVMGITREEWLRMTFGQAETQEKIELFIRMGLDRVVTISDRLITRAKHALAEGLVSGEGIRDITERLRDAVRGSQYDMMRIARTEIIRAHAEGQLQAIDTMGMRTVTALVEWLATDDNRVCQICKEMDGTIMTIDEARGKIPVHPNCRCAWAPHVEVEG